MADRAPNPSIDRDFNYRSYCFVRNSGFDRKKVAAEGEKEREREREKNVKKKRLP